MRDPASARVRLGHLGLRQVDAVRQQRARGEQTVRVEALHHAHAVSRAAILDVGLVLGGVDVERAARALGQRPQPIQAIRREREAGVAADHPAGERRADGLEGLVLLQPAVAAFGTVAVRHLVTERRPQPDLLERALQGAERSADERGRRVVIDEERGAGKRGLDGPDQARQVDRFRIEGPVQPPPDPLQDLHEAPGRDARGRHPPGQGAVQVGVGVDEARDHDHAREVRHLLARRRGERPPALHDPLAVHAQVGGLDQRRVQRGHRRALEQHRRGFYAEAGGEGADYSSVKACSETGTEPRMR